MRWAFDPDIFDAAVFDAEDWSEDGEPGGSWSEAGSASGVWTLVTAAGGEWE